MTSKIFIIDGVYAKAERPLIGYVAKATAFTKEIAIQKQWGTEIQRKEAYLIDRRTGFFLAGLLKRVSEYLERNNIPFEVIDQEKEDGFLLEQKEPMLDGITFRPDQYSLIQKAIKEKKGLILSPTGSGKTIIALGVLSAFPKARACFLAGRLDLINQFYNRAKEHLKPESIQILSGGENKKKEITAQIVVSTIQTMSKYNYEYLCDKFDITIIDEAHHCCTKRGQFGKFMQNNLSPIKLGFTATLQQDRDRLLTTEGLIGPVLGELTEKEAEDLGIIAKPIITLLPIPYNENIGDLRQYKQIYTAGITENKARNAIIIKETLLRTNQGKTCLILVREIEHGNNLMELAEVFGLKAFYVNGVSAEDRREQAKIMLNNKQVPCVICTDVWREGTDIPSLDVVVCATSMKSELYTIQGVGRGRRTTEEKNTVEVIDFLDPYRYLAQHSIMRISLYIKKGWEIRGGKQCIPTKNRTIIS